MNADLIAALHPPRLPESFAALSMNDLLAAFGLGLLLAGLVLTVCAPLMQRRARRPGINERLRAIAPMLPQERAFELARLLQERGGTLSEDERQQLYTGEIGDLTGLENRIRHPERGRV